jgi:MarR family transcriptional regulator, organic hydroperoxide resistance regulator
MVRPRSTPAKRSEQQVVFGIVRVADTLTRRLTEALEPFKLTLSQYSVLESLRGAGAAGLTCSEIAVTLVSRDPDVTRLLDRLELRGLVSRHRGRPDRRVVHAQLTAEGHQLLEQLDEPAAGGARTAAPMRRGQLAALDALLTAAEALT